ncbi:MAG: ComF family protein [Bacteroidetes bacterium]|jgi:ComF family protein|nr:ComF family protein [Bacteroidota bacterium]
MFNDVIQLLFPNLCLNCNKGLVKTERYLCLHCQLNLPETQYHLLKENGVEKALWGRVPFERAFAFLYFNQAGITQRLLHELKYRGNEELAFFLGSLYGQRLKKISDTMLLHGVIAIPLHPSKLRKRGYNQSLAFANGLAETLSIPNFSINIERIKATETQTKKNRWQRWENVNAIFNVNHPETLCNKHLLLVDDVITTGATIESCAKELLKKTSCKLSIASIAYAA